MTRYEHYDGWTYQSVERTLGIFIWRVYTRVTIKPTPERILPNCISETDYVFALSQSGAIAQACGIRYDMVNRAEAMQGKAADDE